MPLFGHHHEQFHQVRDVAQEDVDALGADIQGLEPHISGVPDAAPRFAGFDAILLAHFSTSRAEAAVRARVPCPVLTAPGAAVERLKELVG